MFFLGGLGTTQLCLNTDVLTTATKKNIYNVQETRCQISVHYSNQLVFYIYILDLIIFWSLRVI